MPRVVTVLCHGTNFHRYKQGELVAEFGRLLAGNEIKASGIGSGGGLKGDFIINEGPGSDSGKKDAATPGTVNPLLEIKKGKLARLVDRDRIQSGATADLYALNDAVRRRNPQYFKVGQVATAEAARLGLSRDVAMLYAQHIWGLADLLAGPIGSASRHLADAFAAFRPDVMTDALTEGREEFARHFYGEGLRDPFAIEGAATGVGWDDNVHKTVGRIANLQHLPDVVNLLGWSRGGITCIKIANKLEEVFPQIKVNIFAVDPVYGGVEGGLVSDVTNVPVTVQELWVILSMHERRRTFKPQMESMLEIRRAKTLAHFLPMPGGHDQQVELKRGGPSAEVTWHLAYKCLTRWGTLFNRAPIDLLSPAEVCRKYALMSLRLDNYQSSGTTGVANWFIGLGYADRNLPRDPGLPSPYFLNMHHWVCFQSQFPVTSSYFLQPDKAQLAFQLMVAKNTNADFADIVKPVKDELRNEPLILRSIEAFYAARMPRGWKPQQRMFRAAL